MKKVLAVAALMLPLAGCTPGEYVPDAPFAMDGVTLSIEPVAQQPCDPAKPYAVRVRWSVTDWTDPKFDFHIRSSQGTLWAKHNLAAGEQVSDPFAVPGLWFVMLDRNTRQVVAAQPTPALGCAPPPAA